MQLRVKEIEISYLSTLSILAMGQDNLDDFSYEEKGLKTLWII